MEHFIYKIKSTKTDKIYIGSTQRKNRYHEHTSRYKRGICSENSRKLFDLGVEFCSFEIIEKFNCDNYSQQLDREQFYLDKYKDIIVNQNRAVAIPRTEYRKAHYLKNREKKLAYQRLPEQIERRTELEKERQKVYYHCTECNKQVKLRNKLRHNKQITHINNSKP